ncbi:MAG TPA: hypothetical protein VK777_31295 [Reyranella sp.]|jgi:hypothetical protein|nr:hypothetical protein [Reyranella sp.]
MMGSQLSASTTMPFSAKVGTSGSAGERFGVSLPAYFLAGRGIGLTPTCSSAVYGAP